MLVDCMFSQPYWSLIETKNCCLDHSNTNSVIESTVSQFETPVRVKISTRPPVTVGIILFLIVLSRGSSKWRMFGIVIRKYLSLFLNPLANAK